MSTVKQVEWQVQLARQLGRKIATADEARQIFKIGTWYNDVEETLSNLGLPPNRKGGQVGFIVKENDGKLYEPGREPGGYTHASIA